MGYALLCGVILHFAAVLAGSCAKPSRPLQWDTFFAPVVPAINFPRPNVVTPYIVSTLLHGEREAVLIDVPLTTNQTDALADWIEETIPHKRLTTVYITHGHPDHFLGLPVLMRRFPGIKFTATVDTVAHITESLQPEALAPWLSFFPDIPPQTNYTVEPLPVSNRIDLEHHIIQAIEVGQADTYNSTVVYVPELDLVATGDVVYGSYYLYLAEANTPVLRQEWIDSIDRVSRLNPKIVIPGHVHPNEGFGTKHLEDTRQFIYSWNNSVITAEDANSLYFRTIKEHPNRIGGEFPLALSVLEAVS